MKTSVLVIQIFYTHPKSSNSSYGELKKVVLKLEDAFLLVFANKTTCFSSYAYPIPSNIIPQGLIMGDAKKLFHITDFLFKHLRVVLL